MNEYMEIDDLRKYLKCSRNMILEFIRERELPYIMFGNQYRFRKIDIDNWAEKNTIRNKISEVK